MGMISVDELKPGMVLAEDLKNPMGRFLLPKGTALTDKHLRICKIWGVVEAEVSGVSEGQADVDALNALDKDILKKVLGLASKRFYGNDLKDPLIREMVKRFALKAGNHILNNGEPPVFLNWEVDKKDIPGKLPDEGGLTPTVVISRNTELASLPDIFYQIVEAINSPNSSAAFVADIIGKDTGLSAKLLKLVNSAFYGFPSKIDTLSRAVTVIGTTQLTNLALGISVISMFKDVPEDILDMKAFWEHSVATAIIARVLASAMKSSNEERFFVAGLLHDIGRLIMLKNHPKLTHKTFILARAKKVPLHLLEKEVWGFNHAVLAGFLLKSWKFPATLEKTVRFHHIPQQALPDTSPAVVHLADFLATSLFYGSSGNAVVPPLNAQAMASLKLSRGTLGQVSKQVETQLRTVMTIFFGGGEGGEKEAA